MTKRGFLRRPSCRFETIMGGVRSMIPLAIPVLLAVFAGCAAERLPDTVALSEKASAAGEHTTAHKGGDTGLTPNGLSQPETSQSINGQPVSAEKETKKMWFASKGGTIEHVNADSFKATVLDSDIPVLVDFYADWCGPCRALAPVLEQVAQESTGVRIVKLNVDQAPNLAAQYRVSAIPTLILFHQGKPVQRITGLASKEELKQLLALQ